MWQKLFFLLISAHRFKQFSKSLMANICRNRNDDVVRLKKFQFHFDCFGIFYGFGSFQNFFNEDTVYSYYYYGFLKHLFEGKNLLVVLLFFMGNDLENKTICIVPQFWQVIFSQLLKKVVNEEGTISHTTQKLSIHQSCLFYIDHLLLWTNILWE